MQRHVYTLVTIQDELAARQVVTAMGGATRRARYLACSAALVAAI